MPDMADYIRTGLTYAAAYGAPLAVLAGAGRRRASLASTRNTSAGWSIASAG